MVRPSCLLFGRLGPKKKKTVGLTECYAPNSVSLIWFVGTKLVKDRVFSRTMPNRSISKVGVECSTRVKLSAAWNGKKKKKHNPISQAAGPLRKAVRIWMITLRKKKSPSNLVYATVAFFSTLLPWEFFYGKIRKVKISKQSSSD